MRGGLFAASQSLAEGIPIQLNTGLESGLAKLHHDAT